MPTYTLQSSVSPILLPPVYKQLKKKVMGGLLPAVQSVIPGVKLTIADVDEA
jgi:hypothetical protein